MTQVVFLTPEQAAEILSISTATVRAYARSGIIPARKIGKHWRFLETELRNVGTENAHSRPAAIPVLRRPPPTHSRVAQIARALRTRNK